MDAFRLPRFAGLPIVLCLLAATSPAGSADPVSPDALPTCSLYGGWNAGNTQAEADPMRTQEGCQGAFGSYSRYDWYYIPQDLSPTGHPFSQTAHLWLDICSQGAAIDVTVYWKDVSITGAVEPFNTLEGQWSVPAGQCDGRLSDHRVDRLAEPLVAGGIWYVRLVDQTSGTYYTGYAWPRLV